MADQLRLGAPSLADCEAVCGWREREDVRLGLRTGRMLTEEEQEHFYCGVVSNRSSPHRYWSVYSEGDEVVAFAGLTDINWEAGYGEISLIAAPTSPNGTGRECVSLVLVEAFERMRLLHVFGECYEHNPAVGFWQKMVEEFGGAHVMIPGRKWWDGELHGALLFWFAR